MDRNEHGYTWALLSTCAGLSPGGGQKALEPLLFLSSCATKQVKVLVFGSCLLLRSFFLLLNVSWALLFSFPISQSDADGVFLVPQPLAS